MKEVLSIFTFGIGALCFVGFVTFFKPTAVSAVDGTSKPEVSTVGHGPHQFRTRNDITETRRTRSNSNENAAKSTKRVDIRSLTAASPLEFQETSLKRR